jgi:hypothetical protein
MNEGAVKIKHIPIKIGGRTIYRTLSLKRTPFQTGNDPNSELSLEKDESATLILCDCEAIVYLSFRHLGQFFMEPTAYYDVPINKVLHFTQRIDKELFKNGTDIRSSKVTVLGPDYYGPPLMHAFIYSPMFNIL